LHPPILDPHRCRPADPEMPSPEYECSIARYRRFLSTGLFLVLPYKRHRQASFPMAGVGKFIELRPTRNALTGLREKKAFYQDDGFGERFSFIQIEDKELRP
jgi:hypothetical protein